MTGGHPCGHRRLITEEGLDDAELGQSKKEAAGKGWMTDDCGQ